MKNNPIKPHCGHQVPHTPPVRLGEINYTSEQINTLLGMIPFKADRAEVPEMEKLSDVNYVGHVVDPSLLVHQSQPSWALVGSLKRAKPYFYYVEGYVPKGYTAGWNDISPVLGTYDLTTDKVSIFDFNLVTEYNVSRNHPNIKREFSNDWGLAKFYYPEYDKYKPCKVYNEGDRANMPDYTENTFIALRETSQPPFITIEVSSEFTLGEAVAITPEQYRYPGIRLTFVNSKTHQAETWFWLGGEWEDEKKWIKPISDVTINNLPDEEDISTTKDSIPRLQLKDKLHDKNSYSGLGRCYLRKNMVDGVNVLTQDMFANTDGSPKENTRYIIQYDHDLNGATVEIPEGCVLDFEGGSVSNGVLVGNFTTIKENPVQIFGTNLTLDGTWNVEHAYPEWFGAKGDGVTDDADAIQKTLNYFNTVVLLDKTYAVKSVNENGCCIYVPKNRIIKGSKYINAIGDSYHTIDYIGSDRINAVIEISAGVKMRDFSVKGISRNANYKDVKNVSCCIKSTGSEFISKVYIDNVQTMHGDVGFNLQTYLSTLTACQSHWSNIGFYIHGSLDDSENVRVEGTSVTMNNCYCILSRYNAYRIVGITYSSFINLAADNCGQDTSKQVKDETEVSHPYQFNYVKASNVINCGCEICLKCIRCYASSKITIENCRYSIGWAETVMYNAEYLPSKVVMFDYSSGIRLEGFNMIPDGKKYYEIRDVLKNNQYLPLFYLETTDAGYIDFHFTNGIAEYYNFNNNIRYSGGITKRNVYIENIYAPKEYLSEYTVNSGSIEAHLSSSDILDNPNQIINITLSHSGNVEAGYSGRYVDLKGKTIIFNGSGKAVTFYGQPGLYIKNGTVIFKNLTYTASDTMTRNALFNCTNANLVFDGCSIYNIGIDYSSGYICDLKDANSFVTMVGCQAFTKTLALAKKSQYRCVVYNFPEYGNGAVTYHGSEVHVDGLTFTAVGDGKSRLSIVPQYVESFPARKEESVHGWTYAMTGVTLFYNGKLVVFNGTNWVDANGNELT